MRNNDIAEFFRTQMLAMLTEQGMPQVRVVASFQPDNQGRLDGPVLYFAEVTDAPYGAQGSATKKNAGTGEITDTSTQRYRITYQVQGFAPFVENDLSVPLAGDIVKLALQLLKSPPFIRALKSHNMGIETIAATRPNFVVNDRAQFEAGPMFDFTMSYRRTIIQKSAVIQSADFAINRV